jgi:hypothetical protein
VSGKWSGAAPERTIGGNVLQGNRHLERETYRFRKVGVIGGSHRRCRWATIGCGHFCLLEGETARCARSRGSARSSTFLASRVMRLLRLRATDYLTRKYLLWLADIWWENAPCSEARMRFGEL